MFSTDEELILAVKEKAHGGSAGTVYEVVYAMEQARNTEAVFKGISEFVAPKTMVLANSVYLTLGTVDFQMRNGLPGEVMYDSAKTLMSHLSSREVPQYMELALLKLWAITFNGDVSPLKALDFLLVEEVEEVSWLVPYNGTSGIQCLRNAPEHVIEYVPNGKVPAFDRSRLNRVPAAWRLKVLSERTNQIVEFVWVRPPNSRLTVPQLVKAESVSKPSELISKFPFTRFNNITASLLSNGHTVGGAACLLLAAIHLGIGNGRKLANEIYRHIESDRAAMREVDEKLKIDAHNFFPHLFNQQVEAQTKPLARVVEHWRLGLR